MTFERVETLKDSEKSKVYLVYDHSRRSVLVEKHISAATKVYRTLKDCSHPYLPKLYDVRFEGEETIIHEEYIPGGSLAQTAATEKQLHRWLLELCDALSFLHRRNILHRDIKPSNLLIGSDGHIRLIDFDAARIEKPSAKSDTRLLGTRGYAPPEQYGFAQTDERADIYALGITFQELLGSAAKKSRWRYILHRCTALEPKRRYKHAWQVKWAIKLGRLRRCVLYPMLAVFLSLVIAFFSWSYLTDTDFRSAADIVFSSRRALIFDAIDREELINSHIQLSKFNGDTQEIYLRMSAAYPDKTFISTSYASDDGYLLFGCFSTRFDCKTGERWYSSFDGLCCITADSEVYFIPPEQCTQYPQAVLALFDLDVFDTPLF